MKPKGYYLCAGYPDGLNEKLQSDLFIFLAHNRKELSLIY